MTATKHNNVAPPLASLQACGGDSTSGALLSWHGCKLPVPALFSKGEGMTDTQLEGLTRAALEIVTHDRNEQYGKPEDNFGVIATLWQGYLDATRLTWEDSPLALTPADVARMMELLKMARRMTAKVPKADSYIDAIGYVLCEAKMAETE